MKKASLFFMSAFFFFCSSYSRADYDPITQKMQTNNARMSPHLLSLNKNIEKTNSDWTILGPEGARIRTFETTSSGDTIFLATDSGHLFVSTDRGRHWTRRVINTSLYPHLPAVMFADFYQNVLYVATGLGIYKSSDFGKSWQELITAIEVAFHAIYVDKSDPDILYAATYGENPYFGGFLKSTDGGETWNSFNSGLPSTSIYKLLRSSHNSRVFYAYTGQGLYMTPNAGGDWIELNGNLTAEQTLAFAEHPTDSNKIYLGAFSGLYASNDQGQSWREITPPATTPEIRAIAPGADSLLLVGTQFGVFKSMDNGDTWRNSSNGLHNPCITDIKILSDSLVYLSTMDGFYVSEDAGETWQRRMSGVDALASSGLCIYDGRLFFSAYGAGLYSYANGQWRDEEVDDTFYLMNDMQWSELNQSLYLAYISTWDIALGKSHSGVLVYSPDKKDSLESLPMNNLYVMSAAPSHFKANTLFLGAMDGVYQSIDNGASWLRAAGLENQFIFKIAASPFAANVVFATANNIPDDEDSEKGVFKSEDTGYNFRYTCGLVKEWLRFPSDIGFHPYNPQIMYASNSYGGVIYSYDGGDNWNVRDKLKNGERFYVNAVCCDPVVDGRVYAGGYALYVSEDAGLSWRTLAKLPDGAGQIITMVIDPQNPEDIYVGTTGNGVLKYEMQPMRVEKEKETPTEFWLAQNYPNPFNSSTSIRFSLSQKIMVTISIFDLNGKRIKILTDGETVAGEHEVKWDGTDEKRRPVASGLYFCRMQTKAATKVMKMTLVR